MNQLSSLRRPGYGPYASSNEVNECLHTIALVKGLCSKPVVVNDDEISIAYKCDHLFGSGQMTVFAAVVGSHEVVREWEEENGFVRVHYKSIVLAPGSTAYAYKQAGPPGYKIGRIITRPQ